MTVELSAVEDSIVRVQAAIKNQRDEHSKLVEVQGKYDLSQQETQDSLRQLRGILDQVEGY